MAAERCKGCLAESDNGNKLSLGDVMSCPDFYVRGGALCYGKRIPALSDGSGRVDRSEGRGDDPVPGKAGNTFPHLLHNL